MEECKSVENGDMHSKEKPKEIDNKRILSLFRLGLDLNKKPSKKVAVLKKPPIPPSKPSSSPLKSPLEQVVSRKSYLDKKKELKLKERKSKTGHYCKKHHTRSSERSIWPQKQKSRVPYYIEHDSRYQPPGTIHCKPCGTFMNGHQSWESHLVGKRHLYSTQNEKRAKESILDGSDKYEYISGPPLIKPEIDRIMEPVVGLQHSCEFQHLDGRTSYECFICHVVSYSSYEFLTHLTGMKHYISYIKKYDPNRYDLISSNDLNSTYLVHILKTEVLKIQDLIGEAKMIVKREKPKFGRYQKRKRYEDEIHWPPKVESYRKHDKILAAMSDYRDQQLNSKESDWNIKRFPGHHSERLFSYYAKPEEYDKEFSSSASDEDSYYSGTKKSIFLDSKRDRKDSSYTRTRHETISRCETIKPVLSSKRLYKKKAVKYVITGSESPITDLREKLEKRKLASIASTSPDNPKPTKSNHSMPNDANKEQTLLQNILQLITSGDDIPGKTYLQIISFILDNISIESDEEEKLLEKVIAKCQEVSIAYVTKNISEDIQDLAAFSLPKSKEIKYENSNGSIVMEDFKQYFEKSEEDLVKYLDHRAQEYDKNKLGEDVPQDEIMEEDLKDPEKVHETLLKYLELTECKNSALGENAFQDEIAVEDPSVIHENMMKYLELTECKAASEFGTSVVENDIVAETLKNYPIIKTEESLVVSPDQNECGETSSNHSNFNNGSDKLQTTRKPPINDLYHWYRSSTMPVHEQKSSIIHPLQNSSAPPSVDEPDPMDDTTPSQTTIKSPITFP